MKPTKETIDKLAAIYGRERVEKIAAELEAAGDPMDALEAAIDADADVGPAVDPEADIEAETMADEEAARAPADPAEGRAALGAALAADEETPDAPAGLTFADGAAPTTSPTGETTPTALAVDRWGKRKGEELAADWKAADVAAHEPTIVADAHTALFEPEPKLSERPADEGRAAWFKQLMESPEYIALHGKTVLDGGLAELAAKSICDQWVEYAVENPEPTPGDGDGKGGEGEGERKPKPGSPDEPLADTIKRVRSTSKALEKADETVKTAREAAAGLGLGGDGAPLDPKELKKYYNRVKNDDFLKRLMAMAGRMRTLCQSLQRTKTVHGRDDTVGVELSGDVSRLVPSELAQLACGIPELELLALDRVARKQSLSRQYRGLERLGRGPIVVVVDESGSMSGEPVMTAKAIALALAWLAKRQKRWIALVGFSGGTGYNRIAFAPGKVDQEKLITWLEHFYSGGSDRDIPVKELPRDWPKMKLEGLPEGKTDVIMITDAVAHVPKPMIEAYRTWAKAEQARTYGICIGQSDAGDLAGIADRHWCCPDLSGGAAVDAVLSI